MVNSSKVVLSLATNVTGSTKVNDAGALTAELAQVSLVIVVYRTYSLTIYYDCLNKLGEVISQECINLVRGPVSVYKAKDCGRARTQCSCFVDSGMR